MCELTREAYEADTLQAAVQQARDVALRSPEKWAQALHDLYGPAENDVIFAAMDGDECHAGRVLIQRLREAVIAEATQAAKDAAADAEDEVFERAYRAITEGTP